VRSWPFALACLPLGFAVAQATGVRALGGIVMVALGLLAVRAARTAPPRPAVWGLIAFACFVISHVLADPLGAWGAVALVTLVTGAAGALLLERRRQTAW
jgi:hypothetical protein